MTRRDLQLEARDKGRPWEVGKLIRSVAECVACLSEYEALEPGDIIMTGTPEGVNAVVPGDVDVMHGEIQGLRGIEVRVTG